ncbi:MAG: ribbon-helix-helix domain-containing protein [Anaerolineae bacterium]|nr:ribbon-helix-helix domain-containing protein [Anaerolineae bacterium]
MPPHDASATVWAQPTLASKCGASRFTVSRPSEIRDFVRRKKQSEESMSDNSKSQYTNRLTVHITGAMENRLEQIASQRDEPKAEVVRAALRAYLDEQEDLIGSRKHFTKMFQRRVDYVERLTVISLWINVQVMHMLYERVKKEPYDLTELLEDAIGAGIATESAIHRVVERALQQKTKPPAD